MRNPQGGQKDDKAPVVLMSSPEVRSTRFSSDKIVLYFDEYVQLNDISNQLVVSPPLPNKPKIKVRKKSVIIELENDLLPNTTYLFNFGDGIADVNEQNKAQDLIYVFSTGDVIDSLSISGIVWDVLNDQAAKNYKVMAYENDTAIFAKKTTPLYFAKAKENGTFTLSYMREGDFHLYALDDQNNNYRWDDGEAIGVLSTTVNPAQGDSTSIRFETSIPRSRKLYINDYALDSIGSLKFALDPFYNEVLVTPLNNELSTKIYRSADSVFVWLQGTATDKREPIRIEITGLVSDTLDVPFFNEAVQKSFSLRKPDKDRYRTNDKIVIASKQLLTLANESKISLLQDSIPATISFTYDSLRFVYEGNGSFKVGKNYELNILPGAFVNASGATNDTLKHTFSVLKNEELGTLLLQLKVPDSLVKGRLTMLDKNNTIVFEKANVHSELITIGSLLPGDYSLKLLDDTNQNDLYDPIDLTSRTPSEIMRIYPGKISVRANWDVKMEWKINEELKIEN